MKLTTSLITLGLALVGAAGPALALEGHESGGRIAASTVFLRFTSRGAGINTVAAAAVQSLAKTYAAAGQVAERNQRSWGREGEIDLCIRLTSANARYRFAEALDRVLQMSRKPSDGGVFWTVNASSCRTWPQQISGSQYGIYQPAEWESAKQASLACSATADEPESYRLNLSLYEVLSAGKPVVRFGVYQSAMRIRYRPIVGEVRAMSVQQSGDALSLEFEAVPFTLNVQPTAKTDNGYAVYLGSVKLGTRELDVRCVSGRRSQ